MFLTSSHGFILLVYSLAVGTFLALFCAVLKSALLLIFPEPQSLRRKALIRLPAEEKDVIKALYPPVGKISARDVAVFVTDIVFSVFAALTVIILLYHLNFGKVRYFALIAAFSGFILSRYLLNRFLVSPFVRLMRFLIVKIIKLLSVVISPFRRLLLFAFRPPVRFISEKLTRKRTIKILNVMLSSELDRTKKRKCIKIKNDSKRRRTNNRDRKETLYESQRLSSGRHRKRNKSSGRKRELSRGSSSS